MPGTGTDDDSDGGTAALRSGGDPSAIVNPRGAVGERNGRENGGSRTKEKTMSKRKKKNSENGKSSDDFAICFGHEAVDAHAQYGSESATRCT